jgi:hypothetical protein
MNSLRPYALLISLVLASCASGDDDDGDEASSSVSATATPAELCAQRCQLQVDAGCERMPPDYLASCTTICVSKYSMYPTCEDAMRALDVCSIERIHYGCAEGVIDVQPKGGCAGPAAACFGCTQDLMGCL